MEVSLSLPFLFMFNSLAILLHCIHILLLEHLLTSRLIKVEYFLQFEGSTVSYELSDLARSCLKTFSSLNLLCDFHTFFFPFCLVFLAINGRPLIMHVGASCLKSFLLFLIAILFSAPDPMRGESYS